MAAISGTVSEPLPIFKLAHRYLVYDVNAVTHLRREHNISGVLIGTLPQAPQQNIFSGLPLELMPEEARLLVEKKVAYIVDDVPEHRRNFVGNGLGAEERKAFQAALRKQGQAAAQEVNKRSDDKKKAALQRLGATENWNDIPEDMLSPGPRRAKKASKAAPQPESTAVSEGPTEETLFGAPSASAASTSVPSKIASPAQAEAFAVTPTTSYPPLNAHDDGSSPLPVVSSAYPLYKHLHNEGYFLSPGLRFGCQYMAYPGDPLRFHSHFLCSGMDWEQEFDLLDLVGGGRLGTGVKKGFLIGGEETAKAPTTDPNAQPGSVRAFCVEWGGM